MFAIIRDDDINVSTTKDDLLDAYGDLFGKVPINFFVIPFLKNPEIWNKNNHSDFYWSNLTAEGNISSNQNLIIFLNELLTKNQIGLGLHGIHHIYKEFEFNVDEKKLLSAIRLFDELFNLDINCFSPPNNSMSKENSILLQKYFKFFFISYFPKPWEREFTLKNLRNFWYAFISKFFSNSHYKLFRKSPFKISNHFELPSLPIYYGCNENYTYKCLSKLKSNNNGSICLATH